MKINLVRTAVGLGGVVAIAAAGAFLAVGCGGDDTGVTDAGPDGTGDSMADVGADVGDSTADVGSDVVEQPDAGPDAVEEGDDGGMLIDADASMAADAPPLGQYTHQVVINFCSRLGQCCLVSQSSWNQAQCVQEIESIGGFRGLSQYNASLDSGNVAYDPAKAAKCLTDMSSYPCGTISSMTIVQLQDECFGAVNGTLAVDAGPCKTSLECAPNEFCSILGDAGTCNGLLAQGQSCTDPSNEQCSYLGTGNPAFYCQFPLDGGPGPGQCQPTLPMDAGCQANGDCQSGVCAYPVCGDQVVVSDPGVHGGTCDYFTIKDAGAD